MSPCSKLAPIISPPSLCVYAQYHLIFRSHRNLDPNKGSFNEIGLGFLLFWLEKPHVWPREGRSRSTEPKVYGWKQKKGRCCGGCTFIKLTEQKNPLCRCSLRIPRVSFTYTTKGMTFFSINTVIKAVMEGKKLGREEKKKWKTPVPSGRWNNIVS